MAAIVHGIGTSSLIDTPPSRFFEPGGVFNRVLMEAPYQARCSDNKTAARVRPREHVIRYPYMQINRPGMVSWLIFDLDHINSLVWDDEGLPPPNLIVRNRNNGHSHLFYAIPPVCTTENARDKPIQYMKAVYTAFALRLKADTDYNSGPVAKTPGHPADGRGLLSIALASVPVARDSADPDTKHPGRTRCVFSANVVARVSSLVVFVRRPSVNPDIPSPSAHPVHKALHSRRSRFPRHSKLLCSPLRSPWPAGRTATHRQIRCSVL